MPQSRRARPPPTLPMTTARVGNEEEDGGEFLDDRDRKEIQIAKEKIERAIKHVKR